MARFGRRHVLIGGASVALTAAVWRGRDWVRQSASPVVIVGGGATAVACALALLERDVPVLMVSTGSYIKRSDTDPPTQEGVREPYDAHGGFLWHRFRHVGGRTTHWTGHSPRLSAGDFGGVDFGPESAWPFTYEAIEPYYAKMEQLLRVQCGKDGIPDCPDASTASSEVTADRHPASTILRQMHVRVVAPRQSAGPFRADSFIRSELAKNPKFALRPGSTAVRIETGEKGRRAVAVHVVNERTHAIEVLRARAVVLAAGTIDTARLLLASDDVHKAGLANGSGLVGTHLTDHLFVNCETPSDLPPSGAGLFVPRVDKMGAFTNPPGIRGGFQLSLNFSAKGLVTTAFGMMRSRKENRIVLGAPRGPYGLRSVQIECALDPADLALRDRMVEVTKEIAMALSRSGATATPAKHIPGNSVHEVGTCRMGKDPERSVVDEYGRAHEVERLVLVDGSVFPSHPEKNPTLTMMAFANRAGERLARDLQGVFRS